MVTLIVWCIYVSWEKKPPAETKERRPLAYVDPNAPPCEEVVDEGGALASREQISSLGQNCSPPALRAIGRFLKISGPFHPRRESYDSDKTAVTLADV